MKSPLEKYPVLVYCGSNVPNSKADIVRQTELWQGQLELFAAARNYINNIDVFLGNRLHDANIRSVTLENDCLTICADDLIFSDCFHAVNSLLGLGVKDKKIECPVTIKLTGIKKLDIYEETEEGLEPVTSNKILRKINEFLYDAISVINRQKISIGFYFSTKNCSTLFLDIDARRISFEENTRSIFTSLFGEENLDIFDAIWQARIDHKIGWNIDPAIRLIRKLRPQMPKKYDIQDYYIWKDLLMQADASAQKGKLGHAVEIYKELIPSHWNQWIIWRKIAECLFKMKQYNEASLYLHALLGYNEKDLEARLLLAKTWYALQDLDDAADELAKCLKIDPKYKKAKSFFAKHKDIQKTIKIWAEYEAQEDKS